MRRLYYSFFIVLYYSLLTSIAWGATDPLATWQSTFANLPKTKDAIWAQNFADWADARVTNKIRTVGIQGPGLTFTFNKTVFKTALEALTPKNTALAGIQGFADAWETAIAASTAVTAVGSSIGAPSPTTTWSVVNSTTIVPSSIAAGKAKILELVTAPKVANALDSQFPIKFREAFLLLTITTLGLDSRPPPPGPQPLNDIARAVE